MSTGIVTGYRVDPLGVPIAMSQVTLPITFTGTAGITASAFPRQVDYIHIQADANCHFRVTEAADGLATTAYPKLLATDTACWRRIPPNGLIYVSMIAA